MVSWFDFVIDPLIIELGADIYKGLLYCFCNQLQICKVCLTAFVDSSNVAIKSTKFVRIVSLADFVAWLA